jgi:hypothetical protein
VFDYENAERHLAITVRIIDQPVDFVMSKEFENMCLRPNCIGCGATTHGLLELKMRKKTRNGFPIYIYLCPVVEHEYLYALGENNARGNVNIVFRLCINKYTNRYEHDLEEIEERFLDLDKSVTGSCEIMDRFKTGVRNRCHIVSAQRQAVRRKEYQDVFARTFLSQPCRMCGQEDHSMLEEKENGTSEYSCPIAYHMNWEDTEKNHPREIYRICPEKFARRWNYYQMDVISAYTKLVEQAKDRPHNESLSNLQLETLEICEKNRPGFSITRCMGLGVAANSSSSSTSELTAKENTL